MYFPHQIMELTIAYSIIYAINTVISLIYLISKLNAIHISSTLLSMLMILTTLYLYGYRIVINGAGYMTNPVFYVQTLLTLISVYIILGVENAYLVVVFFFIYEYQTFKQHTKYGVQLE